MNRIIILSLVTVSVIITGCAKTQPKEILKAKFENDIFINISLSLTSDNFYSLKEKRPLDTIENTYTGKYRLKNDTVYFSEEIPLLKTQKAILKNNSVDFNNGVRFLITQTSLKIPSKINLSKHSDIAVFDFNPELYDDIFDKNSKPYDLNENDLEEVIRIFNSCPTEHGTLKSSKYWKQCIAVINSKGEKEVWLNCSCKKYNKDSKNFQHRILHVSDGGPCYMSMKVNLTTHQCYDVHFNGY